MVTQRMSAQNVQSDWLRCAVRSAEALHGSDTAGGRSGPTSSPASFAVYEASATSITASTAAALTHALDALHALVTGVRSRSAGAARLVGGAAGKSKKCRAKSGDQVLSCHGNLPWSWERDQPLPHRNGSTMPPPAPDPLRKETWRQRPCMALAIVPPIAQMGWQRAGADAMGGDEKTNKTETNFGKGACQANGSGLRILQAGRFVIEAAFLIPADWRGLAWALMPISKKLKFARAPAATAETRVTTAATASRRFAIFRIRTWASRPRRPHAAVARSLHVLVRKP